MIVKIQFSDLNKIYYTKEASASIDTLPNKVADLWTEGKGRAIAAGADRESLGVTAWVDNVRVVPNALLSGRISSYR